MKVPLHVDMPTAAQVLAQFASELKFPDIPPAVVERAKNCIIDTVAVATFGAHFPWSRMVADYAFRYGSGGPCSVIGFPGRRVHAPYAALANGVFTNAFEQDSARYPSVSAHCGATLVPAVLAACEETNADGKTAITAFVAGCEVLFRVAGTAHHSKAPIESLGFHGPGITGPYGAAVAVGRVLGLDAEQTTHAMGIAGSLGAGILALTKSKEGGMVKRLHLGRSAESGILAARLAGSGYTGPETILEGTFGFLDTYSRGADPALFTADLHQDWETLRIAMKRYPMHGVCQTPAQALRELMAEHAFTGADVANVVVEGDAKLLSHHNNTEPRDVVQAQYSVPFCVALALFRDPDDPQSLIAGGLDDATIRAACRGTVTLRARPEQGAQSFDTRVTVKLSDGREFSRQANTFKGRPSNPLSREDLRRKLMVLSGGADEQVTAELFERLDTLENQPRFSLL